MSEHDSSQILMQSEKRKITRLRVALLSWWGEHGEAFPWRRSGASTYERVCVEVLLQRTRRETVSAIYAGFFERFPDWHALASCPEEELGQYLQPLGLWRRRAASLGALARYANAHLGAFPSTERELAKVPAVGQYVGNAILLFQHGKPRPLVDVNMARVVERVLRPRRLADIRHDPWLQSAAAWLVRSSPVETNWAVLDFAAKVCRARNPRCDECIFARQCSFAKTSRKRERTS
jgi:A/G-specific adenine glycosylase